MGARERTGGVVGGGAAGLGVAVALRAGASTESIVLERADAVGSSWRGRYDGLQPEHGAPALRAARANRSRPPPGPGRPARRSSRYLEDVAERKASTCASGSRSTGSIAAGAHGRF